MRILHGCVEAQAFRFPDRVNWADSIQCDSAPQTSSAPTRSLRPLAPAEWAKSIARRGDQGASGRAGFDPDRMGRFEREARLLASLDHPNVGAIYGLEESNGT